MELSSWLTYIESLHPREMELGLDRVRAVADRLQLDLSGALIITVAGTNGKGSCVATLDALLRAQGKRVGSYTSPHLQRYNERICVDGKEAADAALCQAFSTIEQNRGEIPLTYFEFGTLAALLVFQQARLDVIVLEVGLGGRLDAVNIVDCDIAVITSIDLDHVAWLGETREQIAREKGGIVRTGKALVCADRQPPTSLLDMAAERAAPLFLIGRDFDQHSDADGHWHWQGRMGDRRQLALEVPVLPALHLDTVAAALQTLLLVDRLPESATLAQVLQTLTLAGRFELRTANAGGATAILDVAHNPAAAAELARRVGQLRDGNPEDRRGRVFAVLAIMQDKDVKGVVRALDSAVDIWYIAQVDQARCLPARKLAEQVESVTDSTGSTLFQDVPGAYKKACELAGREDFILVTGSFFTVAAIRHVLDKEP